MQRFVANAEEEALREEAEAAIFLKAPAAAPAVR